MVLSLPRCINGHQSVVGNSVVTEIPCRGVVICKTFSFFLLKMVG